MDDVHRFTVDLKIQARTNAQPSELLASRAVALGDDALRLVYEDYRGLQRPKEVLFLLRLLAMVTSIPGGDEKLFSFLRQKNRGKTRLAKLRQAPQCFGTSALREQHAKNVVVIEQARDRARSAANTAHFTRTASKSPNRRKKRVWMSMTEASDFEAFKSSIRHGLPAVQQATTALAQAPLVATPSPSITANRVGSTKAARVDTAAKDKSELPHSSDQ